MQAIHSNWTKPRSLTSDGYYIEDFDILTTILSALKWREKNGSIKMATDSVGSAFYKARHMDTLWDELTDELDEIPDTVNPSVFWAAGKLFALKNCRVPTAVTDTDFIVWDRLAFDNLGELTAIHAEPLTPDIYPSPATFETNGRYVMSPRFNYGVTPVNTAFYVIKSGILRDTYVNEAISFMENATGCNQLTYMIFAEQRLLPMCAEALGIDVDTFSSTDRLFADGERYFTHTWGMKQQMRDNPRLRYDFCMRCIDRIKSDFPDFVSILCKIPELAEYF